MTDLTLVSLFDGIAGFPLAFSRAGVRTVATCEIDKAAAGVAAEHFPDAAHFDDVTELTADDLIAAGFDPLRGVVTAGWPCTDLSLAGLRLGLGGARSGLVGEVFRLLLSLRPRWVVLENVPGLLSSVCPCPGSGVCDWTGRRKGRPVSCSDGPHTVRGGSCGRRARAGRFAGPGRCMALHGGGMGTVLRRLGECRYGLAYRVLDAQYAGVPQRRRRVVIVGHLGDWARPAEVLLEPASLPGHPAPGGEAWPRTARDAAVRARGNGSTTVALTTGSLTKYDDNSAQGGHLVASTLQGGGKQRGYRVDAEAAAGGHIVAADLVQITSAGNRSNPRPSGPVGGEVTHALTAEGADASEDGTGRGTPLVAQPLTVREGKGPDSDVSSGNVIAFGHQNGIDPQPSEETAGTIRDGNGAGGGALADATGVRRLTPTECERLQGYPDGWTAVSAGRVQADAPRYRQLGNTLAVPVFERVARNLVAVDASAEGMD